jgi:dihydrolipoamide dehydrogenase
MYDIVIIGSGPGGYVAAIRASQLGMKTAIIEKSELGGVCLNWGCIPTKALLKSAQVFEYIKHSADYGIEVGNSKIVFNDVINRSRDVANGMSKGIQFLMKKNKIDVIYGRAKLIAKNKISVELKEGGLHEFVAKNIILATGARSRELPNIHQDGIKVIGYREAMVLKEQPKSITIIGAGAIGVEFAYFYNSIGTKVTLVEFAKRIVPIEDAEISKELEKWLKKSGIVVMTDSEVQKLENIGDMVNVFIKTPTGEISLQTDIVLCAAGIQSNIENIGLEEVGVKTEKGKIIVNEYYETSINGVYAIGDLLPTQALAHVASAEAITCVEKIAGHNPEAINYNNIPGCTYCYPEIASVGYTEEAARAAGYELKIGKFPFSASGKASAGGNKEGFVKVIFDAKYGECLGAHFIGSNVTEMIAEIVLARKLESTGHEILKAIHPHPTMSESVMEATAAAYGEVIHL